MLKIAKYIQSRRFDLMSGHLGNGITIWNKAKEVHGDYEKIAHINHTRKIQWFIQNPPQDVIDYVEKITKTNPSASATQPYHKVFFD